jgi:peptide deformylase
MYETMYNANGVLAAPQVGKALHICYRHYTFSDDEDLDSAEQKAKWFQTYFYQCKMIKEEGEEWALMKVV